MNQNFPLKNIAGGIGIVFLLVFFYYTTWTPFLVNKDGNVALLHVRQGNCEQALLLLSGISDTNITIQGSYVDVMQLCLPQKNGEVRTRHIQKAIAVLEAQAETRPFFTRTWIGLAAFTNLLIAETEDDTERSHLVKLSEDYIQKAKQLSPKRYQIYEEATKTYLNAKQFDKAAEKAQECIAFDSEQGRCWWLLAKAELSGNNAQAGSQALEQAALRGYDTGAPGALLDLTNVYTNANNLESLIQTYLRLLHIDGENPQYQASIALAYKEAGQYRQARNRAFTVLRLQPQNIPAVEKFILSLPLEYQKPSATTLLQQLALVRETANNQPENLESQLDLVRAHRNLAWYSEAQRRLETLLKLYPESEEVINSLQDQIRSLEKL